MGDPYSDLGSASEDIQKSISAAMEARSVDEAQIAMRRNYLADIELPADALAVELGSGTGHVTRDLIEHVGAARAIGLEFAPIMVDRAREIHADVPGLSFGVGDAKATGLETETADLVVLHTLLCHVPGPEDVISEAYRILKPGGIVAVFDGDYDTASVAISAEDPLQPVVAHLISVQVHDRWITRRLRPLLNSGGFVPGNLRGHAYLAEGEAAYFMTVVERGIDRMVADGLLDEKNAKPLRREARDRVDSGSFFGFMSYVSVLARKPGELIGSG